MTADTQAADTSAANDYDSPWKEALEKFFPEFLALLFPAIHAEIDWSNGHAGVAAPRKMKDAKGEPGQRGRSTIWRLDPDS
ncbi:hypothetical protein [Thiorhodovibrio litoralis]|uniref:hypothetical protein n=1 Tax=Thiorhodovibrio litoralis TaxID=2952932 RepID=UPI002B259471|nr:hypothetical protein [Thiorhodovibrio litoralis]WPL14974.1 hypothetical protein Thiosp_04832 [Thiorhodovibrio litoralis]